MIDERLKEFATPRQVEVIDAVNRLGGNAAAARELGMNERRVREHLQRVRERAARSGYAPDHDYKHAQPPGFLVRGVSTLYDAEGTVKAQWVKSALSQDARLQAMADAVSAIAEPFRGAADPVLAPTATTSDLLTVYPLGDPHLGMLAWREETGADFDLDIAERNLVRAVDQLVGLAPASDVGLVINLGDFFHVDNTTNTTARSHNVLDVDTRWAKLLQVGIRAMRRCIDRALEKHAMVHVINEIGNHDDHSAVMLSLCLANYYEREPRVAIDTSPSTFHWYRHGQCLLGVTHGNWMKPDKLPGIMATDRAHDWGETKHRHWYTGHVHHDSVREFPGCTVETFRTLAARDAWHHRSGYRSGRDMKCDVWHRERGRILRHTVDVESL
jgi:hypothetical protein